LLGQGRSQSMSILEQIKEGMIAGNRKNHEVFL